MNTFVTHPSVRIKGTENNYNPVRCMDHRCPDNSIHMHCPFCVKRDFYHDPVILKAHFRVKHVDKGIDFAGLKILRCCDHCDIVGIIKGEKKFKGAHWHCYKCRNGFNRRDEAIKHYKTHFRNPQTTFQIQIAQEINNPCSYQDDTIEPTELSIHPVLTQAVMSTSLADTGYKSLLNPQTTQVSMTNGKPLDGTMQVSVAANETVDSTDAPQTHIMIIHEDQGESEDGGSYTTQIISSEDVGIEEEKEHAVHQNSDNQLEELQQKYEKLQDSKHQMETQLKFVIENLQAEIKDLKDKLQKSKQREHDLMEQISVPLDKNIENLMKQLETQHRDLLYQQLLCIKREYKLETVTSPEDATVSLKHTDNSVGKETTASNAELFTVSQTFDNSTDPEKEEVDTGDNEAQEDGDSLKLPETSADSANIVCINYSSLPIDSAGNFQVTHHLDPQDDECGDGEVGEENGPSPKRFKSQ
ncbi:uncharacterized protein LOC133197645 [Saccostrea echinata]|uniref:uncharacterized protein LOC133197645 n=1 Tax=Saccostrea echinata TaxID=191078 RepID=UPI002A83B5B8|nr:uncharacterized protein LOC133197645 [Saccostrea echinata]